MGTLRAIFILAVLGIMTPVGMAAQAALIAMRARPAGWLPVIYHRLVCRLLGIRVRVHGQFPRKRPLLVLSNHVSWLDIPVLSTIAPLSFIAKQEVARWPVIGWLARLQRTVFVDRNRRSGTRDANRRIGWRLAAGDVIVLFAEGTSNDGNCVLPFRSALLGAAHELVGEDTEASELTILPVALAYTRINGLPMGRQHRPMVAWHGDLAMGPHVWRLLKSGTIDVEIAVAEPILLAGSVDRKTAAAAAEVAVRTMALDLLTGRPVQSGNPPSTESLHAETETR